MCLLCDCMTACSISWVTPFWVIVIIYSRSTTLWQMNNSVVVVWRDYWSTTSNYLHHISRIKRNVSRYWSYSHWSIPFHFGLEWVYGKVDVKPKHSNHTTWPIQRQNEQNKEGDVASQLGQNDLDKRGSMIWVHHMSRSHQRMCGGQDMIVIWVNLYYSNLFVVILLFFSLERMYWRDHSRFKVRIHAFWLPVSIAWCGSTQVVLTNWFGGIESFPKVSNTRYWRNAIGEGSLPNSVDIWFIQQPNSTKFDLFNWSTH